MTFNLWGIVKHKGRKIANGINGRFDTTDAKTIAILQRLGFKELTEEPQASVDTTTDEPKPRKLGRPYKQNRAQK